MFKANTSVEHENEWGKKIVKMLKVKTITEVMHEPLKSGFVYNLARQMNFHGR